MSSVVYPLPNSKDIYTLLHTSFSNKKFVKINNLGADPCSLDALMMAISKEYQDTSSVDDRSKMLEDFKQELKKFLSMSSQETNTALYKKITEAYEMSNMKSQFKLRFMGEGRSIFDLIIIKKINDDDKYLDMKVSYPLFSTETKKIFMSNSNIFSLLDINFLKDMIEQRYITKIYMEKVKNLEMLMSEEEDPVMRKEAEQYLEMVQFNLHRRNNLSPENLYNSIDSDLCKNEDILLGFLSNIMKFNVFLCRSWSTEISIIKSMIHQKEYPYVIIFKNDTPVSLTGLKIEEGFETGGVKTSKGIKTILNFENDKAVIEELYQMKDNDIDAYYLEKYMSYLNKLKHNSDMSTIKELYVADSSSESEEETSSEEESEEEEMEIKTKPSVLLDETLSPVAEEDEILGEEEEEIVEEDIYIPPFIRSYSDSELIKLLEIFVDPEGNYQDLSRMKLEIMYKNYITSNLDESVDDIMKKVNKENV